MDQPLVRAKIRWWFAPPHPSRKAKSEETRETLQRLYGTNSFHLLWDISFPTFDASIGGRFSTAEGPRRKDHVLTAFGRSAQDRVDSRQECDHSGRIFFGSLRGHDHDHIAFLQIRKGCRRHAREHLLKIAAGAIADSA